MPVHPNALYLVVASLFAVVAAGCDVKTRRIPNRLTLSAILSGLILHTVLDGLSGFFSALAAALICGIVFMIFHLAGGMGAGDVKLVAAIGCIAGLPSTAELLVFTSLCGGLMAVALALARGQLRQTLTNVSTLVSHHAQEGPVPHPELNVRSAAGLRLPYGVAIALGAIASLIVTQGRG